MTSAGILILVAYSCLALGLLLVLTLKPVRLGKYQVRFLSLFFVAAIYLMSPPDLLPMHEELFIRITVPLLIFLAGALLSIGLYRNRAEEFAETKPFVIKLVLGGVLFLAARICLAI
jgi:hypothetical protein